MKKDTMFPNQAIFAVCKEDIRGAFESYFMTGSYYKGLMCQMDANKQYFIYVITDDNGYDFSFIANSEKESKKKFLKLFKLVSKEEYDKYKTFQRFGLLV